MTGVHIFMFALFSCWKRRRSLPSSATTWPSATRSARRSCSTRCIVSRRTASTSSTCASYKLWCARRTRTCASVRTSSCRRCASRWYFKAQVCTLHVNVNGQSARNTWPILYSYSTRVRCSQLTNAGEDVLVFYNEKAAFAKLVENMRNERERQQPNSQLQYHRQLVRLLSYCIEGKNVYTEIKCHSLLPLDDIVRIVTHPDCLPEVQAYWTFSECMAINCFLILI